MCAIGSVVHYYAATLFHVSSDPPKINIGPKDPPSRLFIKCTKSIRLTVGFIRSGSRVAVALSVGAPVYYLIIAIAGEGIEKSPSAQYLP